MWPMTETSLLAYRSPREAHDVGRSLEAGSWISHIFKGTCKAEGADWKWGKRKHSKHPCPQMHFLQEVWGHLPRQHRKLGANCSNTEPMGGIVHSKDNTRQIYTRISAQEKHSCPLTHIYIGETLTAAQLIMTANKNLNVFPAVRSRWTRGRAPKAWKSIQQWRVITIPERRCMGSVPWEYNTKLQNATSCIIPLLWNVRAKEAYCSRKQIRASRWRHGDTSRNGEWSSFPLLRKSTKARFWWPLHSFVNKLKNNWSAHLKWENFTECKSSSMTLWKVGFVA